MTAALAYDAMHASPYAAEHRTAAEDVAVAWAVLRYAHAHPATVEDRVAFEEAEAKMLDAARALGYDEAGLKSLLHACIACETLRLVEQECLDDAPA